MPYVPRLSSVYLYMEQGCRGDVVRYVCSAALFPTLAFPSLVYNRLGVGMGGVAKNYCVPRRGVFCSLVRGWGVFFRISNKRDGREGILPNFFVGLLSRGIPYSVGSRGKEGGYFNLGFGEWG